MLSFFLGGNPHKNSLKAVKFERLVVHFLIWTSRSSIFYSAYVCFYFVYLILLLNFKLRFKFCWSIYCWNTNKSQFLNLKCSVKLIDSFKKFRVPFVPAVFFPRSSAAAATSSVTTVDLNGRAQFYGASGRSQMGSLEHLIRFFSNFNLQPVIVFNFIYFNDFFKCKTSNFLNLCAVALIIIHPIWGLGSEIWRNI